MGPVAKEANQMWVAPLLEGRIRQGLICEKEEHPIEGTVLEIGAGSGMWMDTISKAITP